jgi:hypothetical protein
LSRRASMLNALTPFFYVYPNKTKLIRRHPKLIQRIRIGDELFGIGDKLFGIGDELSLTDVLSRCYNYNLI